MDLLHKLKYLLMVYYQKLQYYVLGIFIIGIVDYFFLYELFVSVGSMLAVEAAPLLGVILLIMLVKGSVKYIKKKSREKRHRLIF